MYSDQRIAHPGGPLFAAPVSRCSDLGALEARHPRLEVVALDAFPASLERSKAFVAEWAAKEAKKGRMSETEVADFLELLSFGSLKDEAFLRAVVPGLDFVIEAVSEDLEVKQSCYGALEAAGLREQSILASNTSSISITKLASQVSRPERVIGMHFMPGSQHASRSRGTQL
ncbi:unnamed protein product [Effrenium voratum]|nr:unnamed protein product [Effrenium voratum]